MAIYDELQAENVVLPIPPWFVPKFDGYPSNFRTVLESTMAHGKDYPVYL